MKVLFVCSQNRLRSLTAESIFDGVGGHQVRSVGTEQGARIRVTAGHLGWADVIFVMEKRHLNRLQKKFRQEVVGKRIICLYIPDDYEYMDEELIDRLQCGVAAHVQFGESDDSTRPGVIDDQVLYTQVGFLFDTDDGSLPEVRLTGLIGDQVSVVYSQLRALAPRINEGACFWDCRANRETPVDAVPNAASLVISGEAEAFHLVLQDPQVGGVALPALGVFVFPEEIVLDYRMGTEWGPAEVAALFALLCDLQRMAAGARVELEEHASAEVREQFAVAIAQYCDQRDTVY